jgi:hypothetical protein
MRWNNYQLAGSGTKSQVGDASLYPFIRGLKRMTIEADTVVVYLARIDFQTIKKKWKSFGKTTIMFPPGNPLFG